MAEVAAMAVSAAGSIAGGEAAQALGAGKVAPKGGGIQGLTSSTGAGKTGQGAGYAIQVDPTTALNYFSTATSTFNSDTNAGLNAYLPTLTTAANDINTGYQQGNSTLQDLSYSSTTALNQEMQMMGLNPLPATASYGSALGTGFAAIQNTLPANMQTPVSNEVSTLQDALTAADQIQDPTARANERQAILSGISNYTTTTDQGYANQIAGIQGQEQTNDKAQNAMQQQIMALSAQFAAALTPGAPGAFDAGGDNENSGVIYNQLANLEGFQSMDPDGIPDANGNYGTVLPVVSASNTDPLLADESNTTVSPYQQFAINATNDQNQIATLQGQQSTVDSYLSTLNNFGNSWSSAYTPDFQAGYTGQQVANVVTSLPGYQFAVNQGEQAIQAGGASKGELASGNTDIALQNFGQSTADSYYNQYMGYLQGVVAQGAPATAQISANQINNQNALSTLAQQGGSAIMQTEGQQATAAYNQLMASGQLWNQDALFNAQAQNNSIMQSNQAASSATNAAIGQSSGLANATNTANAYSNLVSNQNATAAGFGTPSQSSVVSGNNNTGINYMQSIWGQQQANMTSFL